MPLSMPEARAVAARFRGLRPPEGTAERRVWADMVNALTGAGSVREAQLMDFRRTAGWQSPQDRPAGS